MATTSIGWPRDSWAQATVGNNSIYNWTLNVNVTTSTSTTTSYIIRADWVEAAQTAYNHAVVNNSSNTYWPTAQNLYYPLAQPAPTINVPASPTIRVRTAAEIAIADAAEKASQQLVRDLVGEDGYKLWQQRGFIEIESKKLPGTVYRIKHDAIDLFQKKDGNIIDMRQWLCVHPKPLDKGVYPSGDEVATRILLARFAEDQLWETANLHDRTRPMIMTRQEQLARYQRLAAIAA